MAIRHQAFTTRPLSTCALPAAIVVLFSIPGKAQVASGTINITVADATGTVVPAASITVTNNGTGRACNAGNPSFRKLTTGTATGRQIQFGLKYYFRPL
jgi:hypothetical protein